MLSLGWSLIPFERADHLRIKFFQNKQKSNMDQTVCPRNSYVEALIPNAIVFRDRAFMEVI